MLEEIWPHLSHWFLRDKRDLPWRKNKTPYSVWISEIMLQQTQVDVVLPFYLRWMKAFPSLKDLALSSEASVIKQWEGLGYYSRARNLHKGAKFVMEHFAGSFPSRAEDLIKIPGVGPYTVGAILSFAFHQRAPAVDGNVMRVISRLLALEADVSKERTKKEIQSVLEKQFPEDQPWVIAEGLIELGALICKKDPLCQKCPLEKLCQAKQKGLELKLPYKASKVTYEKLERHVGVIVSQGYFLIRKCPLGEVMAGLHEFPYVEQGSHAFDLLSENLHLNLTLKKTFPEVKHSFTRFRVTLCPSFYEAKEQKCIPNMEWMSLDELKDKPFSSGHRAILRHLVKL